MQRPHALASIRSAACAHGESTKYSPCPMRGKHGAVGTKRCASPGRGGGTHGSSIIQSARWAAPGHPRNRLSRQPAEVATNTTMSARRDHPAMDQQQTASIGCHGPNRAFSNVEEISPDRGVRRLAPIQPLVSTPPWPQYARSSRPRGCAGKLQSKLQSSQLITEAPVRTSNGQSRPTAWREPGDGSEQSGGSALNRTRRPLFQRVGVAWHECV
jgi:hypothetical protein